MKKIYRILLFCTVMMLPVISAAQQPQYPIVEDFGGIYEIPDSEKPEAEMEYNIVVDLKYPQADERKVNKGLENVARLMNLHGLGGVKAENLNVVVVVHGEASSSSLNNAGYQRIHRVDNPNIALMDALVQSGAKLYVCGQTLLARGYNRDEVYPEVTVGLSMLTVVTTYMNRGYKKLVF